MDKYYSSIFIKSNWNVFSNYITDILLSPAIQQIYLNIYSSQKHVPLNRNDIIQILEELHFFNYQTDFVAEAKKKFLFIYFQASLSSAKILDINAKKVIYLAIFLISCFDKIIGHLYFKFNSYLYKNENVSFFKPKYYSDYEKRRHKESGEFIVESLFGNYDCKMTIKQIIFTLDKENYKNGLSDFQNNFKNAQEKDIESISKDLINILNIYGIDLDNLNYLNYYSKNKYQINKSKDQQKFTFPEHHSISQIDSDDD